MNYNINRYIKKEILPHFKEHGFLVHRSILFKAPIRDILAGFCFDRSDDAMYLVVFFQPLFIGIDYISYLFGGRVKNANRSEIKFKLDDAHIDSSTQEIIAHIKANIDLVLGLENTISFYRFFSERQKKDPHYLFRMAATSCYLSEPDCDELLQDAIDYIENSTDKRPWEFELLKTAKVLQDSSRTSAIDRIKLLQTWRMYTIEKLGFSKFSSGNAV